MNRTLAKPIEARNGPVTALAWFVIVAGGVLTPISVISFLMGLAGSYGTKTGSALDWLVVVGGPPLTFFAGIGLLRRRRWAWFCVTAILFALLAWQAFKVAFPPPSTTTTYISPSGVPTTVLGGGPAYSVPIIAVCLAMLAVLFSRKARAEFAAPVIQAATMQAPASETPRAPSRGELDAAAERDIARGWRVGHRGRDQMFYEERHDGRWQWIELDGEMLTGRAHSG
jgi:hypothetical protein